MAHLIKLAARQRDVQARLMNDSRKVSLFLGDRGPLDAVVTGLPPSNRSRMEGVSAPSI
ncbi:hypothetical protein FOTG_17957 [Fusarium oxysporum f. sp. vasinfectum 25433]|uniref:Uncharacterized protein n=1 Tax=Fusarium oxysporum f. sp. vasinfectum 25433 TaxID=1089449 RepID=X0KY47_FUSOX|nr:hypothetical protein FOTG_17957 [Fusarium oxysporum f. sp. vasinfectum 25433]